MSEDFSYELAKRLKDAGWPQPCSLNEAEGRILRMDADYAYAPSLEELIDACPMEWEETEKYFDTFGFSLTYEADGSTWLAAYGFDVWTSPRGNGPTPRIAVVELWLALKEAANRNRSKT